MIYRRREGGAVRRGLNILWEPKAKGAILSLPWFSLYVDWNRHTRRLRFALPLSVNWRAPLGPWKRIADMRREIDRKEREIAALEYALGQANERYDKIRATCLQLRETLDLYRTEHDTAWGERLAARLTDR